MRNVIAFAALALAAPSPAAPPASIEAHRGDWLPVEARVGEDLASLRTLAEAFPDSAFAQRRRLAAVLETGDRAAAQAILARLAAMGVGFSDGALAQIGKAIPELPEGWAQPFRDNDQALSGSAVLATIPGGFGLIEGVARDPWNGALYATMVTGRGLLALNPVGEWRLIGQVDAKSGTSRTGSLSGIGLSPDRRRLWLSAAVFEPTPSPERAFAGLLVFDLRAQSVTQRIAAPSASNPSDLTVGSDGTVYASDPLGGAIYVLRPGSRELDTLVAPGRFRSPQGLALSRDGRRLYLSDYGWGLAAIDLGSGAVHRVRASAPMMLDGIDWIGRRGDELIAVQNGTRPRRIIALRLARDGVTVDRLRVLERANPDWSEPAGAFIDGNRLLYVGDARWDEFGPGGVRKSGAPQAPVRIRSLPLD